MKWLAKIDLGVVIDRLGTFKSAILVISVIGICLFTGYRLGNYYHHFQEANIEQKNSRLSQLYEQQEQYVERIHTLEVELTVEQLANQKAQLLLKEAAEEQFDTKKQLAFYEKIMAPEKQAAGLLIDNVKIVASQTPHTYHFQVTLVQQQLKRRYSKGYIAVVFDGREREGDKPIKLKLSDVATLTKKELSFSFQYFQIISGEFTLPANFKPENVEVSAILTKSRWQKYAKKEDRRPWNVSP